jgi:D-aminoacyl-tRNA deacylase
LFFIAAYLGIHRSICHKNLTHVAFNIAISLLIPPFATGVPHLRDDETPPQGGRPGWAALPNPRIGPWLRLLKCIAKDQGLLPEFEVCALHK